MTDWEALGGEAAVADHVRALVTRFSEDLIIGFLFQGRDLERVARHELSFASGHLGGDLRYEGRPLRQAHAPLKINAGQFRRRLALIRVVLAERAVPDAIVARWVDAEARLIGAITDGSDCAPDFR